MSDTMLFGVLRMPYELAMSAELSRRQYWERGQQAATLLEQQAAEIERLRAALEWALGTNGDFPGRKDGEGVYWWRILLRGRLGWKWDGKRWIDAAMSTQAPD